MTDKPISQSIEASCSEQPRTECAEAKPNQQEVSSSAVESIDDEINPILDATAFSSHQENDGQELCSEGDSPDALSTNVRPASTGAATTDESSSSVIASNASPAAVTKEPSQRVIEQGGAVQNLESLHTEIGLTRSPGLLTLPIDSLHSIASFLLAGEWAAFGQSCKTSSRVCREVFRRVRMHGFRCATEVVTAWKLGQHADARELSALYIESGVPIYPRSLGHSYHTLVWRMGIEAREILRSKESNQDNQTAGEDDVKNPGANDRFFVERYESREREGYSSAFTYLEEKSMFLLDANAEANPGRDLAQNLRRQFMLTPTRFVFRAPHFHTDDPIRMSLTRSITGGVSTPESAEGPRRRFSNSSSDPGLRSPKTSVRIHRHLLDQHLLGRPSVNDNEGQMTTAPVSLSVDFFHPHFNLRQLLGRHGASAPVGNTDVRLGNGRVTRDLLPAWDNLTANITAGVARRDVDSTGDDSESESDAVPQRSQSTVDNVFEPPSTVGITPDDQLIPSVSEATGNATFHPSSLNILSNVELDVYSSALANSKLAFEKPDTPEIRHHLATRFGVYQRRLDALIAHGDSVGFEECILDFWDEFLPQTASIHYYDLNTPVPRISSLHKFLTKPCPKAIGIVQCEIERIKLNPKKKRVNMKERFFPKYEYRLFIRHSPPDSDSGTIPRSDTVLMMAKNKGRKHTENSSSQSKKGANNYYLYTPRQDDVEHHYNHVNEAKVTEKPVPNGAAFMPSGQDSIMLGRLQSNFIGTEFQIFTPRVRKPSHPKKPMSRSLTTPVGFAGALSDDEPGYDSGMSSDNASSSSRRRGPFGRLSLRRNSTEQSTIIEGQSLEPNSLEPNRPSKRTIRRSRSSGDLTHGRLGRTSRRAIANTSENLESQRLYLSEEEDGAITYTANLLGSRPRIMDVCIPKVSPEGVAGTEWKKYLEVCGHDEDSSNSRMLNHLKQIQSRIENDEQGRLADHVGNPEAVDDNLGGYLPPEDFGLLALQNRPPWWNIELGSFVLNFGGRVSVASVKNFQLCDRSDQDYIMLQFGRIQGRHAFTMDFQHPLTAVQAFAIAISSLQSKISLS